MPEVKLNDETKCCDCALLKFVILVPFLTLLKALVVLTEINAH